MGEEVFAAKVAYLSVGLAKKPSKFCEHSSVYVNWSSNWVS